MDEFLKYCNELDATLMYADTAMLERGEKVLVIHASAIATKGVFTLLHPDKENPIVVVFPTVENTVNAFDQSIKLSVSEGWKIVKRRKLP